MFKVRNSNPEMLQNVTLVTFLTKFNFFSNRENEFLRNLPNLDNQGNEFRENAKNLADFLNREIFSPRKLLTIKYDNTGVNIQNTKFPLA